MTTRETAPAQPRTADGAATDLAAVFTVEVGRGLILGGNAAAAQLWGASAAGALSGMRLDRAMPALARLAVLLQEGRSSSAAQTLVFWTPRGAERLSCRVKPIAGAPGEALIEVAGGMPSSFRPAIVPAIAAKISHEIRTPLTSILGFAEIMREERFGPIGHAKYREYCRDIEDSARHALSLVNDLMELSRAGAGSLPMRFVEVDANKVAAECLAAMQPIAERAGVTLVAELAEGRPRVVADERALKQILLNLLSNAIKFTAKGGEVRMSSVVAPSGALNLVVADTGKGMTAEEALRALQPFEQIGGDAALGGIGLGLPIAKALAEANGGRLIIESEPGRGTRVRLEFGVGRVVAG